MAGFETRRLTVVVHGRFSCTAAVPTVTQLLEFGADYLLARDRDSLGVERVLQYSIGPPARRE